jgi:3-hydroxyisobutyrate dehydrogenase-like beta-hydroxyacid dehydrogenase
MNVAQIGLGAIGSIYAEHLLRARVDLAVYDKSPERLAAAVKLGARGASSLADVTDGVDYLLVSLPDPDAARAAMLGPRGAIAALKTGAVILDLSTIDPDTAIANEAAAKARGLYYLEAPVSGGEPMSAGTDGARNKNVTFMAGGETAAFEAALPLMSILGKHPLHLGPAGTGATVKLISNYIAGLHNLVAAEAFALGRAAGISVDTMLKTFAHTDANSYWLFNYFAPRIKSGDFEPGFSVDLQYKDLRLCEDIARRHKVPMPLNGLALQIYQMLRGSGRGGRDLVEAANLLAEMSGLPRYGADAPL